MCSKSSMKALWHFPDASTANSEHTQHSNLVYLFITWTGDKHLSVQSKQ